MHDAAATTNHYDLDHTVELDDQADETEELTPMQCLHNGAWHRRTVDLSTTACGEPIHSQFTPLRRESYVGELCVACFTPHELELARRKREQGDF